MAIVKCPDCGKMISDLAPTCIGCGRPMVTPAQSTASVPAAQSLANQIKVPLTAPPHDVGLKLPTTLTPKMQDSVRRHLYDAILGEDNRIYYITKFEQFDLQGIGLKPSWNWPAFLIGGGWALYRKMYGWFFAYWGITVLSSILEKSGSEVVGAVLYFIFAIPFAIYANSLYHKRVQEKIATAQLTITDDSTLLEWLRTRGGVNTWVKWVGVSILVVALLGIVAAIAIPNFMAARKRTKESSSFTGANVAGTKENMPSLSGASNSSNEPVAQTITPKPVTEASNQPPGPDRSKLYSDIIQLEGIVKRDPGNYQAWVQIGNDYFDLGEAQKSIDAYSKALTIKGDDPNVLTDIGVMYRQLKDFQKALDAFRRAVAVSPTHPQSRMNIGVVLMHDFNDPKGAIVAWEDFLRVAPNDPNADNIRRTIKELRGK